MDEIYLLSHKKETGRNLADFFKSGYLVTTFYRMIPQSVTGDNLKFIFVECSSKCVFQECFSKFLFLFRNRDVPFGLIRPIVFKISTTDLYAASILMKDRFGPDQIKILNKMKAWNKYACSSSWIVHPANPIFKIAQVQRLIVENPFPDYYLSSLAKSIRSSPSWLSAKFKDISGVSLNSFMVRIKLCHSLWQLIASDESFKSIAYGLGYHPFALSKRFAALFKVHPSKIKYICFQ